MLDGIPLSNLGAPTLLGIAILLLLTGGLYTKAAYKEKCEEAERWRMAYEKEREARATSDAQVGELLEVGRTTNAILTAVFRDYNTAEFRKTGNSDVAPKT